jgi:predicted trehalose synthase
MIGAILVVVGVAGELITEYKASEVEGRLQSLSRQTEGLLFSEASDAEAKIADDNSIATNAANDAAALGVTVSNLHSFVDGKEKIA